MNHIFYRARGWAVLLTWGIALAVFSIPAFAVYLLTRDPKAIFRPARLGCRLGFLVAGVEVEVHGLQALDPAQPYVFVANHQSNMDPPLLFVYLRRDIAFLAKKELYYLPIFYPALKWIECARIDRSNREAAIASLKKAAQYIRGGRSYIAFPEGTRSADGRMRPFKKGAFHLAMEAGVPVVPVTILGTHRLMPKTPISARAGKVSIAVHPPVVSSAFTAESIDDFVAGVEQAVASHLPPDFRPAPRAGQRKYRLTIPPH